MMKIGSAFGELDSNSSQNLWSRIFIFRLQLNYLSVHNRLRGVLLIRALSIVSSSVRSRCAEPKKILAAKTDTQKQLTV